MDSSFWWDPLSEGEPFMKQFSRFFDLSLDKDISVANMIGETDRSKVV